MAGQDKDEGGDHYTITDYGTSNLIMYAFDSTEDELAS